VNVISKAKSAPNHQVTVLSDLENLEASILKLTQMLERVTNYVDNVLVRKNRLLPAFLLCFLFFYEATVTQTMFAFFLLFFSSFLVH